MTRIRSACVACLLAVFALPAHSRLLMFDATLTGAQEVPAIASTATGFGTVLLDDVALTITVNLNWTGLTGGVATLAHIHGPAEPGFSAAVLFPFSGVLFATAGSIPEQVFPITVPQILQLESGLDYFNVHSTLFPAGEIRGQIMAVPEPETWALLLAGLGFLGWQSRRRAADGVPRVLSH